MNLVLRRAISLSFPGHESVLGGEGHASDPTLVAAGSSGLASRVYGVKLVRSYKCCAQKMLHIVSVFTGPSSLF